MLGDSAVFGTLSMSVLMILLLGTFVSTINFFGAVGSVIWSYWVMRLCFNFAKSRDLFNGLITFLD